MSETTQAWLIVYGVFMLAVMLWMLLAFLEFHVNQSLQREREARYHELLMQYGLISDDDLEKHPGRVEE